MSDLVLEWQELVHSQSIAFISGFIKIEQVEILQYLHNIRKANYPFNYVASWMELWVIKYLGLKKTHGSVSQYRQMNVQRTIKLHNGKFFPSFNSNML